MSGDKRQRTQAAVIDGIRSFPLREGQIDSSPLTSDRCGSPTIFAFVEDSRTALGGRQSSQSLDRESFRAPLYNATIQDTRMTLALFVETKFIPEHVESKARAGQTHYQAILKHLITPEVVNRIYNPSRIANARLKAVPHWPYLDAVRLCDLSSDHVLQIITAANAAGYSAQTVKHIKNVFFAIISHAQKEGCFNGPNPAGQVKLPKIRRTTSNNLTFEQTKAILHRLQYPAKQIALFAVTTDMSLVEICNLQWKHVNLSDSERLVDGELIPARTLAVRTAWNGPDLGDSRLVGRNRNIEIREPLFSALGELKRHNSNPVRDGLVMTSNKRGPIVPSSIRMCHLKQVGKALGLPWLTWQVLRRARLSFAGELLSQLNTPGVLSDARISAKGLNPSEASTDVRGRAATSTFEMYRCRTSCFGWRFREAR